MIYGTPEAIASIQQQHPDHMVLFRIGDFYEAFFDDAHTLATTCGLVLTKRNGMPMTNWNSTAFPPRFGRSAPEARQQVFCERL